MNGGVNSTRDSHLGVEVRGLGVLRLLSAEELDQSAMVIRTQFIPKAQAICLRLWHRDQHTLYL